MTLSGPCNRTPWHSRPARGLKEWPIVGNKIYPIWSRAHTDLPGLMESLQPKIGELARKALSCVASIGVGMLSFLASFIVAGDHDGVR